MDVCKTDIRTAARLLQEAATYIQARARSAREADKARQMMKLSKKLTKKNRTMKEKSKKIPLDTSCIKGDGWSLDQSLSADKLSVKKRNVTTLRAKRDQNRE